MLDKLVYNALRHTLEGGNILLGVRNREVSGRLCLNPRRILGIIKLWKQEMRTREERVRVSPFMVL